MKRSNHPNWHAPRISRRGLLLGATLAPLAIGAARAEGLLATDWAHRPTSPDGLGVLLAQPEGRIVRGPFLEESPLHAIDGLITPTRLHFIRNHTPTPLIDPDTWKLTVDGEVDRPLELSYEDVLRLSSKSMNILLECAGNSRSRYSPLAEGTAWTDGAASVAEWTGVSLGDLLRSAGIRPNAVHVVAQGGDAGKVERGLPVDVALGPDTLLAYAMNGDTLPADHGFPLRLVVPGWIGVASVKWLE
ncbi:MAG: molybdopterin-dependent oxidoreductase, partial [Chloroflexi bacterium]|nr:molybdopterin-dependent oxidoreductase [Chloroflexota bacterium]